MQDALRQVPGVSKVVYVSPYTQTAKIQVEKGKVKTDTLIKAVETIKDKDFKAKVAP